MVGPVLQVAEMSSGLSGLGGTATVQNKAQTGRASAQILVGCDWCGPSADNPDWRRLDHAASKRGRGSSRRRDRTELHSFPTGHIGDQSGRQRCPAAGRACRCRPGRKDPRPGHDRRSCGHRRERRGTARRSGWSDGGGGARAHIARAGARLIRVTRCARFSGWTTIRWLRRDCALCMNSADNHAPKHGRDY